MDADSGRIFLLELNPIRIQIAAIDNCSLASAWWFVVRMMSVMWWGIQAAVASGGNGLSWTGASGGER